MTQRTLLSTIVGAALLSATVGACSTPAGDLPSIDEPINLGTPPDAVPATPQVANGDPQAGFDYLVNGAYIPCGVPHAVFRVLDFLGKAHTSPGSEEQHLDGRNPDNDGLPYNFTRFKTPAGADLVSNNCLTCHAGHLNGKLIVGLGATDVDFSHDASNDFDKADLLLRFALRGEDKKEWEKLRHRMDILAPYSLLQTTGPTIANMLMPVIMAHHDAQTLEWMDAPAYSLPPPTEIPVDVPPWWNLKKKNAMFYNAMGRGDFTKHMMLASAFCVDSVPQARAIHDRFADVKAYVASINPPSYPFSIDSVHASKGRRIFTRSCASCHGTYGSKSTFPNRLIDIGIVGTDPLLLSQASLTPDALAHHAASYFGDGAPSERTHGYLAPPLDGIWATAPYLHNGSVPTLRALLDSTRRPRYWSRTFDSLDYNWADVSWNYTEKDHGKSGEGDGDDRIRLYDTTLRGYGNAGHLFGDSLTATERDDLLEYLKTL